MEDCACSTRRSSLLVKYHCQPTTPVPKFLLFIFVAPDVMRWLLSYIDHPDTSVSAFLDNLADVLERVSTFACPIILMGDVNIHLDVADDPHVIKWRSVIDSYGLVQHVTSTTHKIGHILDVIVTESDCQ